MGWIQNLIRWLTGGREGAARRVAPPPSAEPQPTTSAVDDRDAAPGPARRPPQSVGGLDASQFAPLSHEQTARAAATAIGPGSALWMGRRDRIPPASDPRTRLIDQAMVGQGLLTSEDLVEIHGVGEEMDVVRPDLANAIVEAEAAVQRSREDRAALKARKKAEAAERRRSRAEQVANRRANDIVFLGRGVSKGLADRNSDGEKLRSRGLPLLATPADLAAALGISIPRLRWLAFHAVSAARTHYVTFKILKKGGGDRWLAAPHRSLAACQEWILRQILDRVPVHGSAHGFIKNRSTVTNATPHARADLVLNVDLLDFFPSIDFHRTKGVFEELGYSPCVATILALLCTECPRQKVQVAGNVFHVAVGPRGLPQGACTSPAISNLVVRRLDSRLSGLASKLGWTYTRYADDLTFSAVGEPTALLAYLMSRVRHFVSDEGFSLHPKKTRVQRRHTRQCVTGIVVNERPGVPRETARRLRAILHHARREGLAAQNRENRPNFESWLRGMIAYVQMVNPQQGDPLWRDWLALMTDPGPTDPSSAGSSR